MSAVVAPTEEEAYLLAILDNPDGLDLAEFCWFDPESPDGCYRAWDFQWSWYTCPDVFQVDQGARALGKTVGITMRAFAFPFNFEGQKMLLTAPELNHLRPLTDAIEQRLDTTRLIRELRPTGKGGGINKQPHWQAKFTNGAQLVSRLPNKDGKGVKGCSRAGTLITTLRGQVPIEEIQVGDMVLTHRGRFREVLDTFHYQDVLGATVAGAGHRGMQMSDYHTMWGRRNRNPQRTRSLDAPEWFMPYYQQDVERWYMASPTVFPAVESSIRLEDMWLVGRWVADGHKAREARTGVERRLVITVSEAQLPGLVERLNETGRRVGIGPQRANGTFLVGICSTDLCVLVADFGELADGKEIPTWLLGAPREHREAFLDGYLSGDGSFDAKKKRWTAGTASKKLAIGLRLLGQTLGYTCGLSWVDPKITHIAGVELKNKAQRCWRVTFTASNRNAVIEDGFSWQKIRSVTPIEGGIADVYDFTVADDHSYIADGIVSSNQHVIQIELDEAQDYPLAGWIEIVETLNRGLAGAGWRCHGVPKGVRDKFYEITEGQNEDADIQWTVHRPKAMNRPTWSPQERAEKTKTYGGSRQAIDYKRNIYGEHGDATNAVFVIAKLMATVDTDEGSKYNSDVYQRVAIEYERLPHDVDDALRQGSILTFIDIPGEHFAGWSQKIGTKEVGAPKGYSAYWGGMDVGVTNHPSEILLFGQRVESDHLDLLLRVHMQRINTDDQKFVVGYLFERYGSKLKGFALDKTGVGFPIWDQLSRNPTFGVRIHGFNFSEKRVAAFSDRPLERGETQKDLVIERNVVEAGTDWLRNDYVDAGKIRLPYDKEILLEFQGQTYTIIKDTGNPYGTKRLFGGGSFHTLDAAKMVMAGMKIPPLEAILNQGPPQPPILDQFMGGGF